MLLFMLSTTLKLLGPFLTWTQGHMDPILNPQNKLFLMEPPSGPARFKSQVCNNSFDCCSTVLNIFVEKLE